MSVLPEPIIDFHVHLFPDRLFDAIWRYFQDRIGLNVLYRLYYRECVDYLRAQGVGTIVYSNYAHKEGLTRVLNEWNRRVLDEIPNLFCFAPYHPDDGDALAMAEAIIDHPRILGFKLQLVVQQLSPCDNRLYPLYELLIAKKNGYSSMSEQGPSNEATSSVCTLFERCFVAFRNYRLTFLTWGGLSSKNSESFFLFTHQCTLTRLFRLSLAHPIVSRLGTIFWKHTRTGFSTVRTSLICSTQGRLK